MWIPVFSGLNSLHLPYCSMWPCLWHYWNVLLHAFSNPWWWIVRTARCCQKQSYNAIGKSKLSHLSPVTPTALPVFSAAQVLFQWLFPISIGGFGLLNSLSVIIFLTVLTTFPSSFLFLFIHFLLPDLLHWLSWLW